MADLERAAELVGALQLLHHDEGQDRIRTREVGGRYRPLPGEGERVGRHLRRGHLLQQLELALGLPPSGMDGLPCEAMRLPMGVDRG